MTKLEQTSVPAWAVKPLIMDAPDTAASATVLSFTADGDGPAAWLEQLERAGIEHRTVSLDIPEAGAGTEAGTGTEAGPGAGAEQITATVNELVADAQVGFRLLLFGPLPEVLRARAAALEAGLLEEEISIGTTCVRHLPLYCVHCCAETLVHARIDDVVPCPSCGTELLIFYHVSRRAGSFLGFKNDAEAWHPTTAQPDPAHQDPAHQDSALRDPATQGTQTQSPQTQEAA